jgi:uncharacterized oxidoreductase
MHSNTIFITGGSSGIGKGLAEAFHKLGNQVIISGRRVERLQGISTANPGMRHYVLDVTDPGAIRIMSAQVLQEFPNLNCIINNAGIQRRLDLSARFDDRMVTEEINTNLLGVIRVAAAFIPHLVKRENAVLINVSSGLAFVPLAGQPVYCATKAAVHSLTLSLRHQLKRSGVKVIELIPPWVETELGGVMKTAASPTGRKPMPLDAFIEEAMRELASDADEVAVAQAENLVGASCLETVKKVFDSMNG